MCIRDSSKLDEELQERKAAGAYPTTEFSVCDLKEYAVESTDFSGNADDGDMPFDAPSAGAPSPWFGK